MLFSGGGTPQPASYLFIDGASLSKEISGFSGRYLEGAGVTVAWSNLRASYRKVFYYDALPVQKAGESVEGFESRLDSKKKELATIERTDSFHIRTGELGHSRKDGNKQKGVDVQLAVDALLMASRGLFSAATIITGDLDFRPLISALVDMGIDVSLQYPRFATSNELLAAADRSTPIGEGQIASWVDAAKSGFTPPSVEQHLNFHRQIIHGSFGDLQTSWVDNSYGICELFKGDQWRVVTQFSPLIAQHFLNAYHPDLIVLRHWLKRELGIELPEAL